MRRGPWRVVRYGIGGDYGVMRTCIDGRKLAHIEYGTDEHGLSLTTPTHQAAQLEADRRNGKLPSRLTAVEFDQLTTHVPMLPRTRAALRAILVDGRTWQQAAQDAGITQSGILRARRRIKMLNDLATVCTGSTRPPRDRA